MVCGALVALATALVFRPVLGFDFLLWDDNIVIVTNEHIRSWSADNLWWMATAFSRAIRYIPVSWLLWSVDYHLGGLRPAAFHAPYFALHVVDAVLVYALFRRLLALGAGATAGGPVAGEPGAWSAIAAALGASVWAMHPQRAESVAWVTGGTTVLSVFFLLPCLLLYLRQAAAPAGRARWLAYLAALAAFVASLLSHPFTMAVPALLVVLDVYPLRRLGREGRFWGPAERAVWIEKLPFVAASGALLLLTLWVRLTQPGLWESAVSLSRFGPLPRLAQALFVWAFYAWRPLVPFGFSPVYTDLVSFDGTEPRFLVAAAVVLLVSLVAVATRRRWPALAAAWCAHLALLVPLLGLTERPHFAADRYTYLVGLCGAALVAAGVFALGRRGAALRGLGAAVGVLLVAGLAVGTRRQVEIWRDNESLFRHMASALGRHPLAFEAYYRLAITRVGQGKPEAALVELDQALQINPSSVTGWALRGSTLAGLRRFDAAAEAFREALRLGADAPTATRAALHNSLGLVLLELHREGEALPHFQEALAAQPQFPEVRRNLAVTLARLGRYEEAREACLAVLRASPDDSGAAQLLGQLKRHPN